MLKTCKGIVRFKYYPYLCTGFKNKQNISLKKKENYGKYGLLLH